MSEPRVLVEHFIRHEYGRLVAVLTRSLGVRRLALVEDVVQAAFVQAPVRHLSMEGENCLSGEATWFPSWSIAFFSFFA